jgi:predicted PurR-regulated permease PerM
MPAQPYPRGSAGEAADAARIGHERDLELTGEDRAVSEHPSEHALLHLDRAHARETDGGRAALGDAVHDQELVGGDHELRAIPAPDRGEREDRSRSEEERAREAERCRRNEDQDPADEGECERTGERAQESGGMRPLFETNLLPGLQKAAHAQEFSASAWKSSFGRQYYGENQGMRDTARKAFVAALVVGGVVVFALALWKLRVVIALLFLAFIIAAAMRPSVEWLREYRIPRGFGILGHYLALIGMIGLLIWFVVPSAIEQIQEAVPTTSELREQARESSGIKQRVLLRLEQRLEDIRLEDLPSATSLLDRAADVTRSAFEVLIGIVFTLACAAYWIFERDRAMGLVLSLVPTKRRRVVRDTWDLIDLKLGAYVRGTLILVLFVATLLSLVFYLIGLPFWLLIGIFAGFVEVVPVIGPLLAGAVAVGVGFTESWELALAAGLAVLGVRLLEDYLVIPRVLGNAVGLTPLSVLVAVSAMGILFGGFAVLLAIPVAAVLATLVDVIVRHRNPAEEDVPAVLFPAKDVEEG